jgi:hypothetical protein
MYLNDSRMQFQNVPDFYFRGQIRLQINDGLENFACGGRCDDVIFEMVVGGGLANFRRA